VNDEPKIDDTSQSSDRFDELATTCFVIMPFGKKEVGGKEVDFNAIYKEIFEPAIQQVKTPEGKPLIPERTDMDAFSGSITQEMFEYIMYSRLAFADISGFNPNVFYEIGARHSAQESGTVLFRQTGHAIPFDITTIKVFEYDHEPATKVEASRTFITQVLSETLKRNRLDSPVRLALRAQWSGSPKTSATAEIQSMSQPPLPTEGIEVFSPLKMEQWKKQEIERFMRDAEESVRLGDLDMARTNYWGALRFDPLNTIARMRLGLTLKRQGQHYEALQEFATITKLAPDYGEAWKEKGIIEGLIARMIPKKKRQEAKWLPDGYASLERATLLIPDDFDAWSSLGGILKNVREDYANAHKMYTHASNLSDSHPYPFLNALKMEALHTGKLDLDPVRKQLKKAKKLRLAQTLATPPADTPWCYFDLAEIQLYQRDKDGFLDYVRKGIECCDAGWQPETFRDSLQKTLVAKGIAFDGLADGIKLLDEAIEEYKEKP
jgi:tetratricopeptide (TPR) repeat protein